jgi:hypothetical protein
MNTKSTPAGPAVRGFVKFRVKYSKIESENTARSGRKNDDFLNLSIKQF